MQRGYRLGSASWFETLALGAAFGVGLAASPAPAGGEDRVFSDEPMELALQGEDGQTEKPAQKPAQKKEGGDGSALEPVEVFGEAESWDQLVGPYTQPAWTARHQRFGTTRAYVLPPGVMEAEFFYVGEYDHGSGPGHELLQELKIGLPHRFQLDLYAKQTSGDDDSDLEQLGNKVEVRWALADWGEIPLNPTAYFEWDKLGDSDTFEYKFLFAETLGPKLHWASNVIYEQQLNNEREQEVGLSNGLSYTLIEKTFSVGLEGEVFREWEDGESNSEDAEWEANLGPSVEWRPTEDTSLRVAPLFGLTDESHDMELFVLFGVEFGPGSDDERLGVAPAEVR
jgi:hypothetical protein